MDTTSMYHERQIVSCTARRAALPTVIAALVAVGALIAMSLATGNVPHLLAAPTSQVLCVDDNGGATSAPCANPTAFTRIQDAVSAASSGDEVRVAAGTYVGSGSSPVVTLNQPVILTGGYQGGAGGWTTPGNETQTVIDGQGARHGIDAAFGGTATVQNLTVVNGTILIAGATINNDLAVRASSITHNFGTIQGTAPITVTNIYTWTDGTQSGTGHTDLLAGAQLNINGNATANTGRTINNFGSATWTGNTAITLNSATFNNEAGATFTIAGNGQTLSNGVFNNLGTMTQTSSGDTNLFTTLNNSGVFHIQSGRPHLSGGDSTGTFDVSAGATLAFCNCNAHIFEPSSVIGGAGTLEASGGGNVDVISGTISVPVLNVDGNVQIDSAGGNTGTTVSVLNVSGRLDGSRTISVTNQFDWSNTMAGSGHTVVLPSAVFNIDIQCPSCQVNLNAPRVLDNYGDVNWNNPSNTNTGISNGGTFINEAGASFPLPSSFIQDMHVDLVNLGNITKLGGGSSLSQVTGATTLLGGLVDVQGSLLRLSANGTSTSMLGGTVRLSGGRLEFQSSSPFSLQGGTLEGLGTITGNVNNQGGIVSPGLSPGLMTITGDYIQGPSGTLDIELGGLTPITQYDRLAVNGTANLDGTLSAGTINGFTPNQGDAFTVLLYGSRSGVFSHITGGSFTANYNPGDLTLVVGQGGIATATPTLSPTPGSPTRTPTVTRTPTFTSTPTNTSSPTQTPTITNSPTITPSPTHTTIPTITLTPSNTPTLTRTATSTQSPTTTSTPTLTFAPTLTNSPTSTLAPTQTPTRTNSPTITVTASNTPTAFPSNTNTSTPVNTNSPTSTLTSVPTGTNTSSPSVTSTPTITPSPTQTLTNTSSPTTTRTPTITLTPLLTFTLSPTQTPTRTGTPTGTLTATRTPSTTATRSVTPTATNTALLTDTSTPSPPVTLTSTPSHTNTPTPSATLTASPTSTPSASLTLTPTPTATQTTISTSTASASPTLTGTSTATNTSTPTLTPTQTGTVVPATGTLSATGTRTATPTATASGTPCGVCNLYFADTNISCNSDGTVHWSYVMRNNGDCAVTAPVTVQLRTRHGYSGRFIAVDTFTQTLTFQPGDSTIDGDICHTFSRSEDFMDIYVRVEAPCRSGNADHLSPFIDVCSPNPTCPLEPHFSDVPADNTFAVAIEGMAQAGSISGYADGSFRPGNPATRGQVAKMLVKAFALAEASPTPGTQDFSDVPNGSAFYIYVEAAYHAGLISGYADGSFRPGVNVTRGQTAKMLVEAVDHLAPAGWHDEDPATPTFLDVPRGSAFYRYVETAYANGVISGYSDHTFRPSTQATRGQLAQITMFGSTAQLAKYPHGVP